MLTYCTKQGTNNARIEYKYPAILYGYWKNLINESAARATLLYLLCFSRLIRNEQKDVSEKKQLDNKKFIRRFGV